MAEFFQNYGFFVLIAVLMLVCHMGHGGHGHTGGNEGGKGPGKEGGHQH